VCERSCTVAQKICLICQSPYTDILVDKTDTAIRAVYRRSVNNNLYTSNLRAGTAQAAKWLAVGWAEASICH
jgi:hypothetical protein